MVMHLFSSSKNIRAFFYLLSSVLVSFSTNLSAQQDTLRLTLTDAEQRFAANNLQLLAAKFSIDAAKATALQASLWDNPTLAIEHNIYNRTSEKFFDIAPGSQSSLQIQQLFLLAGKRNKRVRMEDINTSIAEAQLYDILRTLSFELRDNFVDIYYLRRSLSIYDTGIEAVRGTVNAFNAVYQKGTISLKEVLRLKALMFTLETERKDLLAKLSDKQALIRMVIGDTTLAPIIPIIDPTTLKELAIPASTNDILAISLENRSDIRIGSLNVALEEANLDYQKALGVPDLTLGATYDRNGSAFPNYFGLQMQISLPFFNRNQGAVQASESMLKMKQTQLEMQRQSVRTEVLAALQKAKDADDLYKNFDSTFTTEYNQLITGIVQSYNRRNISVLEFTDTYESYKNAMIQMNQLQNDRLNAFEQLNYSVGKTIIRY